MKEVGRMEEVYRKFMELTKLPDNETKEKAMESSSKT